MWCADHQQGADPAAEAKMLEMRTTIANMRAQMIAVAASEGDEEGGGKRNRSLG